MRRGAAMLCHCAQKGLTALHLASLDGKLEVARLLLEGGADMNIQDKVRVPRPLCTFTRRCRSYCCCRQCSPAMLCALRFATLPSPVRCVALMLGRTAAGRCDAGCAVTRADRMGGVALCHVERPSGGRAAAAGARRGHGGDNR